MSPEPYYEDELVRLYVGDCREVTAWLEADVLVFDPPYGIGWRRGDNFHRSSKPHPGISGDEDTSLRDTVLEMWGDRPAAVFGSFYAPFPPQLRQVLVWRKPADAGVVGAMYRWRRDVEPVFITGPWPRRNDKRSSLLISSARLQGSPSGMSSRYGHPHAKPVDVLEELITDAPPPRCRRPDFRVRLDADRRAEPRASRDRRGNRRAVRRDGRTPSVAGCPGGR